MYIIPKNRIARFITPFSLKTGSRAPCKTLDYIEAETVAFKQIIGWTFLYKKK